MKTDSPAQYLTIDGAGDPNTATSYRQSEGTVAQTLHVGAYDAEGPTIIRQPVTAEQP